MSKRFGKARVEGCECTDRFTCGACLRAAPPWHYTPSSHGSAALDADAQKLIDLGADPGLTLGDLE